jgi:hypothetical protein
MTDKKLSLRLDDLRIDSFDTTDAAAASPRGTVRANQEEHDLPQGPPTNATCWNTCGCWTWADASCPPDTVCIG